MDETSGRWRFSVSEGPDVDAAGAYLAAFGYMAPGEENLEAATRRFQNFNALKETGKVDEETAALFNTPRCGVPDIAGSPDRSKAGGYQLSGCDYFASVRRLSYKFANVSPDIPGDGERDAIRAAFDTWSAVTPLEFVEVDFNASAHISIGWYSDKHGDTAAFDGRFGVLAHAYFPPPCGGRYAGHCHFDEDEAWGLAETRSTFDLQTVALHEIGHLLGLAHSQDSASVMYAYHRGQQRALTADDIEGVQHLYGKPGPAMRVFAHVQSTGDVKRRDNEFIGTRRQKRRLEGFRLELVTPVPNLSLEYMAHLQSTGDTRWRTEGQFVGTRGEKRRLEGFAIRLTGSAANNYTVSYMAHVQGIGDTRLYRDGEFCGTRRQSRRVEGILVRIEAK